MKMKLNFNLKRLVILSLALLSLGVITSCKEERKQIDNVIAIGYLNDDIYLLSSDNNSLLLEGYDLIQESIDEYMYFRKDNLYGYINVKGKEVIAPTYERAYLMKENKAVVVKDGKHLIINNEGEVLYTLPNNITSNSYFSENYLKIELNGKFGFLKYDEETNEFILPGEFAYDFALPFSEGYAVVGIEEHNTPVEGAVSTTSIKYNYLRNDYILLFEEYSFDEAESFSNGLAKVGIFTNDVRVESVGTGNQSKPPKYYDMNVYYYIDLSGKFLIDQSTNAPLECHYGSSFENGVISTAIIKYYINDAIIDNLFKDYTFYNGNGEKLYESCFEQTAHENINIFWPTNLMPLGPNHVFGVGKQSVSWTIMLAIEDDLNFTSLAITVDPQAQWVSNLAGEYYKPNSYIEATSKYPYHLSDIYIPKYSNDTRPLMVAQISFQENGKYGLLQFNYDYESEEQVTDIASLYSLYYIVPPIYDRIVL